MTQDTKKTENMHHAEDKQQIENAHQAEDKKQTENTHQAEDKKQTENTHQAEDKKQTENTHQAEDKKQTENTHQVENSIPTNQVVVFKNNMPNLTVLKVLSKDFETVKEKLKKKLKQAPMMFIGMQLIIDLSVFDKEECIELDVEELISFLQREGVNPIALMSDRPSFRSELIKTGLGVIPVLQNKTERSTTLNDEPKEEETKKKEKTGPRKTFDDPSDKKEEVNYGNLTIHHPVRSGQRFYSEGDLTIIGSVSHGAEVIAEGNIHVYGKLSGRAIAGAKGNLDTSIFCQNLDAELVSIAGNYKQLEDIGEEFRNQRVQISLEVEKLCFFSI